MLNSNLKLSQLSNRFLSSFFRIAYSVCQRQHKQIGIKLNNEFKIEIEKYKRKRFKQTFTKLNNLNFFPIDEDYIRKLTFGVYQFLL